MTTLSTSFSGTWVSSLRICRLLVGSGDWVSPETPAAWAESASGPVLLRLAATGRLRAWTCAVGDLVLAGDSVADLEVSASASGSASQSSASTSTGTGTVSLDQAYAALAAVLALDGVAEAALLRSDQETVGSGAAALAMGGTETHTLLYIVPSVGLPPRLLLAQLRREVEALAGLDLVLVDAIPRRLDGSVDREALAVVPRLDEVWLASASAALIPGDQQDVAALVLATREPDAEPRVHLHDVLARRPEPLPPQPTSMAPSKTESTSDVWALADGGPCRAMEIQTLPALLAEAVFRFPDQGLTFLDELGAAHFVTYAHLQADALLLAEGLRQAGQRPGQKVLLQCPARQAFLTALWGCWLAGLVPVPTAIAGSYAEANQVNARLFHAWEMLGQPLVLTTAALLAKVKGLTAFYAMDGLVVRTLDELRASAPGPASSCAPEDLALLLMTSGSTGKPKLVMHRHNTLLPREAATVDFLGMTAEEVSLNWLPLDHVASIVDFHLRDLYLGCHQVQVPTEYIMADPMRWMQLIDTYRVSVTWAPNFAYALVAEKAVELEPGSLDLSCLRHSINAGEAIVLATALKFLDALAPQGLRSDAILPAWGMSETASGVSYAPEFCREDVGLSGQFMDLGKPIPGMAFRIVDEDQQLLREGQIGRLQVHGVAVTPGYYDAPEQNAEVFCADGWFKTGDLAKLEQGRLLLTGREKDVIIIHGLNYYCHEIESVVEEIPGVQASFTAACAVRDRKGSAEKLALFCHLPGGDLNTQAGLVATIRERVLRQVGLFPEYVLPLERAAIPKTGIGKIQRASLRAAFESGTYDELLRQLDLAAGNEKTLPHFFHRASWFAAKGEHGRQGAWDRLIVLTDENAEGRDSLLALGFRSVVRVARGSSWLKTSDTSYRINPEAADDFVRLAADLALSANDTLVYLWHLGPAEPSADRQALLAFPHLLAAVRPSGARIRVMATASAQVAATDRLRAERTALASLVQTAAQEGFRCDHLDVDAGDAGQDAQALALDQASAFLASQDLLETTAQSAWRQGQRYVQKLELHPFKEPVNRLRDHGTYLITGGMGGLGELLARYLLRHHRAHVVLTGRSRLEEHPALAERVEQLKELPGQVHYVACELGRDALRMLTAQVWGEAFDGIFHLAGVYVEGPVTAAQELETSLVPKLDGLRALAELPLTEGGFLMAVSSLAALFGASGKGAYAAANRALEGACAEVAETGRTTVCLAFSPWDGVGMNAAFAAHEATRALGFHVLSESVGLQALLIGLGQSGLIQVGIDCRQARMRPWLAATESHNLLEARLYVAREARSLGFGEGVDGLAQRVPVTRVELETLPRDEQGGIDREALAARSLRETGVQGPLTETQRLIGRLFGSVLGVGRVGLGDNFFALGGHSILALQLLNLVRDETGIEILGPVFLAGPTVAQLAEAVDGARANAATAPSSSAALAMIEPNEGERHKPFPLTDIQQAYFIGGSADLELSDVAMHLYLEIDVVAADRARLEQAWREVVQRHDMLRAMVLPEGLERILPEVPPYSFPFVDLSTASAIERTSQLAAWRAELSHQKIAPDQWPGFEIRLAALPDGVGRLFVSIAALHVDGGSFFLILTEWGARYRDANRVWPRLSLSYRDYALALKALEGSPAFEADMAYWRARLPKLPDAPALPYAAELGSLRGYHFAHAGFHLEAETWSRLKRIAGKLGISRSAMGLAAYGAVLGRWSRSPELCLNVTLFNRLPLHPEVGSLAGDFTSMVLTALAIDGQDSFETLARRVQGDLWEDLGHRQVSGVKLMRELARLRRAGSRALMPVVFTSALDLEMGGATSPYTAVRDLGTIAYQISQTPQVVLDCQLFEDDGRLLCMIDAVTEAFPPGFISALSGALEQLFRHLGEEAAWKGWPLELPAEQRARRLAVNATEQPYHPVCMHQLCLDQAAQTPEAPAVLSRSGSLSYAALVERAKTVAAWLRAHGAAPNSLVGVALEKGADQAVATLGIQIAGAAYLPMDPNLPTARRDVLLESGNVRLVLSHSSLLEGVSWPQGMTVLALDRLEPNSSASEVLIASNPADLAYVIFTSGSTGTPKGVMMEHQATANTLLDINRRFGMGRQDRIFGLSALSFDLSVYDLFGAFAAGAAVVLPDPGTSRDPAHWMSLIHEHQVSVWNSVPALMDILVTFAQATVQGLPSSLRVILMSGDWVPVSLPDRIRTLLPQASINSLGGATEAAIWSILYPIGAVGSDWKSVPYGKPMDNQRFHVLDPHLRPCPDYVPGELYIGGIGLARGYWGDREKTHARFFHHPVTGERLYRTGDLGRYLGDGNIEFLGREDFQVKVQGFRIELGEIESVLESCDGVRRAVVLARGSRDEGKQLLGFVSGDGLEVETLRARLAARLPDYMVPATLMILPDLPLSATGKVDRQALLGLASQDQERPEGTYVAPNTPLERELASLWCELLGVSRISMFDDLMQVGTNSLLAIKAVAWMRARLDVEVPLRLVLSGRATLADLCREIQRLQTAQPSGPSTTAQLPKVVPDPASAHLPFRFNDIQEAYWVGRLDSFELGGVAAYFYLEVGLAELDPARLEQAWQRVIDRHAMLRAIFLAEGRQVVLAEVPAYRIELLDLRDYSAEAEALALRELRARMSQQVLPADRWPLFEKRVSRLRDGSWRIHFGLDLLIADAWSVQILFADLERFYSDPARVVLPFELSFRDYLSAEDALIGTATYERAKNYWWARLDHLPLAPALPLVKDLAEIKHPVFERCHGTLTPETWRLLTRRASERKLSPSGLLLAAFAEVLGTWSRSRHMLLNVTTFNRLPLHPQVEDIVGDFTTLNLLEVDGLGDDFEARAQRIQERLWEDLEHRSVGGLAVSRELGRRRGRRPGALAPIVFTSLLDSYGRSGTFVPLGGEVVFATSQTPQVWLDYQVREQDGILYMTWDVVAELLPEGLPAVMFAAYKALLERLALSEELWNAPSLGLLPSEQRILRDAVNATASEVPRQRIHDLFLAQAERTPDAVAVIGVNGQLVYRELAQAASALAERLRQNGATPNTLIPVFLEKGPEQAIATLGIMMAGAAYLPLDPAMPAARRDQILETAAVRQLVSNRATLAAATLPAAITAVVLESLELGSTRALPAAACGPDDLAYVIFTSGSTGLPKGVMIEHAAAVNTLLDVNRRFQVGPEDRLFGLSALSFDLSVYDLFGAFAAGAAVVMPDAADTREPSAWLAQMRATGVSIWNSVPALMEMLTSYVSAVAATQLPSSLRLVLMSGDWIPVNLPERIRAAAPGPITLISMGGATEASIWSILYPIGTVDPAWSSIPYGKPMVNQRFHVLDAQLEPCPTWVAGDLYIGGVGLARGYWGDTQKTQASFQVHPRTGERLYKTGDLGRYLPDGEIEFLGREDFQVKVQGFRIELGEIEVALARHPDVQAVVVAALGKRADNKRLVAYIVPHEGQTVSADSLRAHLSERVPEYMVPSAYVSLERLPLTPNGKVDRSALPEPNLEPSNKENQGPVLLSPLQKELIGLWEETLGFGGIGLDADFFELGGNSLMAIRLISALQQRHQVEVSLRDFFAQATVAGLASLIGRLRAERGDQSVESQALDLPPFQARPSEAFHPFALNDIQQAYWMGRQRGLELGGIAAHFYFELELETTRPERIERAWRRLIQRHDMLRVVFLADGRQKVLAQVPDFTVPVHDLRTAADAEAQLLSLRDQLSHQVLPTDQWPLFEIHVSLLSDTRIRAHFSFDLLLADAWSALLLFGEFTALYHEPELELKPLGLSYRDYMRAMEQFPQTRTYQKSRAYWKSRVASLPDAPQLPLQLDPSSLSAPRFERRLGTLDRETWTRLQHQAAQLGLTPSGLLLAAYAEVLGTWSASPAFTINVTTFNRLPIHPDIDDLVGDFTSLTLLACDGRGATFGQRAQRVQEQLWADLDHRFYSGIQVIRDLASHKGRAPGALMPVVFTSRLFSASGGTRMPASDDGTPGKVVFAGSQTPQVWLDKQVFEEDGVLGWTWDSVEGLFPDDLLDQMFSAYVQLLTRLADETELWRSPKLCWTPAALLDHIQSTNATQQPLYQGLLHTPFFAQAAAEPDRPAILGPGGLTYRELAERAAALAGDCRRLGARSEQLVAIILDKGPNQVIAALAILQAGGAYLPIDPHWPEERRSYILERANVSLVLTDSQIQTQQTWPAGLDFLCLDQPRAAEAGPTVPMPVCASNLAYVIFTSGSTGRPKGVAIEHRAAANTIADINQRFGVGPNDRVFALSALAFDLSVYDLFGTLWTGAALAFPEATVKPDPSRWLQALADYQITVWNSVPALMELLLTYAQDLHLALPPHLRLVLLSGDWLPIDIADRLRAHVPMIQVLSLGGATEGSIWSIYHPVASPKPGQTSVPYGTALANQQMYILSPSMSPRPAYVPGEIFIGGVGVARNYYADPVLSARAYVPDPFGNGARLYKTGDLGRYLPDATLEFLGRVDFQVKVQGHRIELGEIEAALAQHPQIRAAVVTAPWIDGKGGPGGSRRLVAYLVAVDPAAVPEPEQLRLWLSQFVPEYMQPGLYMVLEALPLSANGKVDRKALPAPQASALPIQAGELPVTPMEARLAAIWKEILQVEHVSRTANFFDLGGNSLLALKLLTRLRETLDRPVSLQILFDHIVLEKLAVALEKLTREAEAGAAAESWPQIEPDFANRHQDFPLTQVQQAYWIGRMQGVAGGSVAAHAYYELESRDFDLAGFERGFNAMIQRHDALRIIIDAQGRQRILERVPEYPLQIDDLRYDDAQYAAQVLAETRERMSHQVLATETWPIFEVRASLRAPNITRLHLSFDLLISDAWSSQVLFQELALFLQGKGESLEPLTCSFRDYVLAEEELRHSERYAKARAYWLGRLDQLPPAPELPLARVPEELGAPVFVRRSDILTPPVWKTLKERAAAIGLTPSGLLLTAFCEVLGTWSASERFTLNLTTFNRLPLHPQVNLLMGDFTSLTLLAVDISRGRTFSARARAVQEQLWADLEHRHMNGVEVLREMVRAKGGGMQPRAPIVFTSRLFAADAFMAEEEQTQLFGEVIYSVSQTPQVWLDHQVVEEQGQLSWTWDAVADLFPEGLVAEMFAAYTRLLQRLAADPEAWTATLSPIALPMPVFAPSSVPHLPLLHEPLFQWAQRTPDAPVVLSCEQSLSFAQVARAALALGHELRGLGVLPDTLVAIVMEKGYQQVIAAYAVLVSGAAYLPIDAHLPPERIRQIIESGQVSCALVQEHLHEGPAQLVLHEAGVTLRTVEPWLQATAELCLPDPVQRPDQLAYVIFTSGSTGTPKGVALEHQASANTLWDVNQRFQVNAQDRVLGISSMSFDLSVYDVFGVPAQGGALVLPRYGTERDPAHWAMLLHQHQVTVWNSVPALLEMLVEAGANALDASGRLPASLRLALLSGDWIPVSLPERVRAQAPQITLISMGGATEAAIWSILYPIETVDPSWPSIPYGFAMENQAFYVLDSQLNPRPTWVPGELYIGGVGLARLYWRDPDKTQAAFVTHPVTGQRIYKTGDHGRFLPGADGQLGPIEFLGRQDLQVKILGHRVELGEIEAALLDHPGVAAAVVAAPFTELENHGTGRHRRLVAYIVPSENEPVAPTAPSAAPEIQRTVALPAAAELETLPDSVGLLAEFPSEQLGQILATMAYFHEEGLPLPKYRYASAGSLYPVQVYLTVKDKVVAGLPGGAYVYHPRSAELLQLCDAAELPADAPQLAFHLVARMSAVGPIYPKWAWSFCALEAGYMRLLLRREAETCGVPLHPLGGALLTFLRQPLGLESSDIWCCSLASQPGDRSEPPKPESPKWAPIDDHVQRLTFKLSQPGLPNPRTVLSRVALPLVGDTDQQRQTFCRRRSARAYLPQTLTLETFAAYLAQLRPTHLRICICLTGHAVAGLEAGAWLYDSANHSLQLIQAGAAIARTDHVLINRPIHDTASFMLFMVAPDSPQVRDADLIHAGELGQILQDDGFPHQIAVCALGVMESNDNIRAMFQLGPNDQILQNFIGGPVPPETFSMFQAYQEQQAVIRQMVSELPAEDRAKGAGSDLEDGEARPLLRHSLTDEQLKRFLADRLPHYMVPGIYLYLARLPLTDNGKVDRKALPQPDARTASTHQGEGIPTDDLEQLIADLIAQILNQTKVGTYDNFFELGANSLQLVQLQGRLQEELQQQVPITTLFSNPTVVALAGALRGTEQETAKQEGQERAKMRQKAQQRKKPGR